MVQVKKEAVRQAIFDSALAQFSEHGYHKTKLPKIAEGAGVGVGSIYSYFTSKMALLYAVYEPWQESRFVWLAGELDRAATPRDKLRCLLLGIWRDIPQDNIGLANSLMEALSAADPVGGKTTPLLKATEQRVLDMLHQCLPQEVLARLDVESLPNLIMMAYDGFVINRRLNDISDLERLAETMCDMMLGADG